MDGETPPCDLAVLMALIPDKYFNSKQNEIMNTYNENLHNAVVETLSKQEQELHQAQNRQKCATLRLFYAEEARMNQVNRLIYAETRQQSKQALKSKMVKDDDLAHNMTKSTTEENEKVALATTNSATSAANVQTASNASVKFASTVSSVYSILQSSDAGSDIHNLGTDANDLANLTAYYAEVASQVAMDASGKTALVPAAAVAEEGAATSAGVGTMLTTVKSEYDTAANNVMTISADLAAADNLEKAAEGDLTRANTNHKAMETSFDATRDRLNLGLKTSDLTEAGFMVNFNGVRNPFPQKEDGASIGVESSQSGIPEYPITRYFILVAKSRDRSVFSIELAQSIIARGEFTEVSPEKTKGQRFLKVPETKAQSYSEKIVLHKKENAKPDILFLDINGDPLTPGQDYVVFLFLEYSNTYKAAINDFSNSMAAPSTVFRLHYKLPDFTGIEKVKDKNQILISVGYLQEIEQRCFLLPYDAKRSLDKLATEHSQSLTMFSENLCVVPGSGPTSTGNVRMDQFVSLLDKIEAARKAVEKAKEDAQKDKKDVEQAITKAIRDHIKPAAKDCVNFKLAKGEFGEKHAQIKIDFDFVTSQMAKAIASNWTGINVELKTIVPEIKKLLPTTGHELDYLFNATIALQITRANYSLAQNKEQKDGKPSIEWTVDLTSTTTDIFGNRLRKGAAYIPVAMSIPSASNPNSERYTYLLTDYKRTTPFTLANKETK